MTVNRNGEIIACTHPLPDYQELECRWATLSQAPCQARLPQCFFWAAVPSAQGPLSAIKCCPDPQACQAWCRGPGCSMASSPGPACKHRHARVHQASLSAAPCPQQGAGSKALSPERQKTSGRAGSLPVALQARIGVEPRSPRSQGSTVPIG